MNPRLMGVYRKMAAVRQGLFQVNLFKSGSDDPAIVVVERWSSRIYLVLFVAALGFLATYTALQDEQTMVTIDRPSLSTFESLSRRYLYTLRCPCSKTNIPQSTFMFCHWKFHQVCASSFVQQEWIDASFPDNLADIRPIDARTVISSRSQSLRFLCEMSTTLVNTTVALSLSYSLSSIEALSRITLEQTAKDSFDNLYNVTIKLVFDSLTLFNFVANSQSFISALGTNAIVSFSSEPTDIFTIASNKYQLDSGLPCRCSPVSQCSTPAAIYATTPSTIHDLYATDTNKTLIKGMKTDCYPYNGLLASTLECYYDTSCFALFVINASVFQPLNDSLRSQFMPTQTVETLAQIGMVEEFSFNYSFESYYAECAPQFCVYTYMQRTTILVVVSTIVGVVSGLNTALSFILPTLLPFLFGLRRKRFVLSRNNSAPATQSMLLTTKKEKLLTFIGKVKSFNLFDSDSNEPRTIERERRMTQVFAVLFVLICAVLAFYMIFAERTRVYAVQNPSENQYQQLYEKYSDTLQCPCRQDAILFQKFMSIEIKLHPVCSSGFVSPIFISQLYTYNETDIYEGDFIRLSATYFAQIAFLCSAIENHYNPTENGLIEGKYFSIPNVIPLAALKSRMENDVSSLKLTMERNLNQGITRATELLDASYVISISQLSSKLRIEPDGKVYIDPSGFSHCSCIKDAKTCSIDGSIYDYDSFTHTARSVYNVTGIRTACSTYQSILQSSLACWYSPSCYQEVVRLWQSRNNYFFYAPPLLNVSDNVKFAVNDTIMTLLWANFIDSWSMNWSYSSFYHSCSPSSCTYSTVRRESVLITVTNLIGVASGLSVALQLVTPFFIHMIYWCLGYVQDHPPLRQTILQLPQRLRQLNLFFNRHRSTADTVATERWTTRLYLLIWLMAFIILIVYNSFTQKVITATVSSPDEPTYVRLYASYNASLSCQCSAGVFTYGSFVGLNARLHQICGSPFVTDPWIDTIFGDGNWTNLPMNEFRSRGVVYFLIQRSFCDAAQNTIITTIEDFLARTVARGYLVPADQHITQMQFEFDQRQESSVHYFVKFLMALRSATQLNQLMNVFSSNWIFTPIPTPITNVSNHRVTTQPVSHGPNCSCATSSSCTEPVFVRGQLMPGFVLGCSPMESLLRSSLSCLYNATCIEQINFNNLSTIHPLDPTVSSRYRADSLSDELIHQMYLEEWLLNISYSSFFAACQASSCTYSISPRKEFLEIITALLGMYAGLALIFRAITPWLVSTMGSTLVLFTMRRNHVVPFI